MDAWRDEVALSTEELAVVDAWRGRLAARELLCAACGGEGKTEYDACPVCGGERSIDGWTALKVWVSDAGDWALIDDKDRSIIEEAAQGNAFGILRNTRARCPLCRGDGSGAGGFDCQVCDGHGWMTGAEAALLILVPCPHCGGPGSGGSPGTGWDCGYCGGMGVVDLEDASGYHEEWYEDRRPYAFAWEAIESSNVDGAIQWFSGAEIAPLMGRHGDWRDKDYTRLDFTDLSVSHVDLSGSRFDALDGSDFSGCKLDGCSIGSATATKFGSASLVDASLGDCEGSDFAEADLTRASLGSNCRHASFDRAILAGADLVESDLTGSSIEEAANLEGANLTDASGLTAIQIAKCIAKGARIDE